MTMKEYLKAVAFVQTEKLRMQFSGNDLPEGIVASPGIWAFLKELQKISMHYVQPHLRLAIAEGKLVHSTLNPNEVFDILHEKFKTGDSLIRYPVFSVVIPLSNPNGHNYTKHEPCLIVSSRMALRLKDGVGNNLPDLNYSVRPATNEEIEYFFENVSNLWEVITAVSRFQQENPEFGSFNIPV